METAMKHCVFLIFERWIWLLLPLLTTPLVGMWLLQSRLSFILVFLIFVVIYDKLLYFCTGRNIVVLPACSGWLKDIHIALLYYFILMVFLPNAGQTTALIYISFVLQNILLCMYVSMCVLCQTAGVVTLLRFW